LSELTRKTSKVTRQVTIQATRRRRRITRSVKAKAQIKEAQIKKRSCNRPWKIHCSLESKTLNISPQKIRTIVKTTLACVSHEIAIPHIREIHVLIINDARMREINFQFRSKDKTTDVLSFPQYSSKEIRGATAPQDAAGTYLGDLVISSETTLRQAKKFKVTKQNELIRLIVHGILHLIGYDHEGVPSREAQAMRRRERKIRKLVEAEKSW